jgi:hypothetical protein
MMRFQSVVAEPPPGPVAKGAVPPASKVAENLLTHIPAEASGFYLMAVSAVKRPDGTVGEGDAIGWGVAALGLLILVRVLAKATPAVLITSMIAFVLWMAVLDVGTLSVLHWGIPAPRGAIAALLYSTVVTALASAGKLR